MSNDAKQAGIRGRARRVLGGVALPAALLVAIGVWHGTRNPGEALQVGAPPGPEATTAHALPQPEATQRRPRIEGSDAFVEMIEAALDLLESRSPEHFEFVIVRVPLVREAQRSAAWVADVPPVVDLSFASATHSVTWCAGILAHEAYHIEQHRAHAAEHGLPVPASVYSGVEAEKQCVAFQIQVLEAIAAPAGEIQHLRSLPPDWWDLTGDGRYTQDDFLRRDW